MHTGIKQTHSGSSCLCVNHASIQASRSSDGYRRETLSDVTCPPYTVTPLLSLFFVCFMFVFLTFSVLVLGGKGLAILPIRPPITNAGNVVDTRWKLNEQSEMNKPNQL